MVSSNVDHHDVIVLTPKILKSPFSLSAPSGRRAKETLLQSIQQNHYATNFLRGSTFYMIYMYVFIVVDSLVQCFSISGASGGPGGHETHEKSLFLAICFHAATLNHPQSLGGSRACLTQQK